MLPRIAVLMLRGVEGCGVTTYVRQLKAYFDDNNGVCDIYAPQIKIGRGSTSPDLNVNFFNKNELSSLVESLNINYDAAFIQSVPATKGSSAGWLKDKYIPDLLEKLNIKRVLLNLDHHDMSFSRNAYFPEAISLSDKVVCYSLNETPRGFIRYMKKRNLSPNLTQLYNFYHIPRIAHLINTERPQTKKIIHAARAPYWKRASLLFNTAQRFMESKYVVEIMGFERSAPAAHQLRVYAHLPYHTLPEQVQPAAAVKPAKLTEIFEQLPLSAQSPEEVYAWGPYEHDPGLKRISDCSFALHPRTFEHNLNCYGNNHEFQGLEAGLLSVPIFHRHFLETVGLPSDPSHKLKNFDFLLEIDDDNAKWEHSSGGPQVINFSQLLDKMEDIYYNKYKETRELLIDFFKTHYSSDVIVPSQLEEILS